MTSSLSEIRDAIKRTVSQAGLNVYDTAPDVTNSPACVIQPSESDFKGSMRMGGDRYWFDLFVVVARTDTRESQERLDQYVTGRGPKSIREFIFHNSDLGLPDVDCFVDRMRGYGGTFDTAGTNFVGAVLRLCVTVT
ncbi:hypothetical protein ACGFZA_16005 [Streptomyces sp. NPDC048211]|uniref:hypothetical protein n=1 Tax=Streptomyces sp. NPDC048211 TaxID=3365516 RepID=UPI0037192B51